MFNMSSAMGGAFATAATEMSEKIAAIGPSPLRIATNPTLQSNLGA
jgi:coenzyme F420-reducing hydrogenase delta subunit